MKNNKVISNLLAVAGITALLLTGCQSNTNVGSSSAETEELKQQIARLEQQISALEQMQATAETVNTVNTEQGIAEQKTADQENAGQEAAGQNNADQKNADQVNADQKNTDQKNTDQEKSADQEMGESVSGETPVAVEGNAQTAAGQSVDNTQNQSQPDANAAGSTPVQTQSSSGSADGLTTYTMNELSDMVNAFVAKAQAVMPGGTASQDLEQFFALKQEEEQIDDLLDRHEDELENLYRQNSLTREEYNRLERELDRLEDQLDDTEDQLERVFGIDD